MKAFREITARTDLLTQLATLKPDTLYVVGHSLGGAMATTIALFLQQRPRPALSITNVLPYTFAAPTSGDATFAAWFDKQFPNAVCIYNKYDLVPNAWATLWTLPLDRLINQPFYPGLKDEPSGPGPTAELTNEVGILITTVALLTSGNTYVQPTQQPALNARPSPLFRPYPGTVTAPVDQFMLQVGFQHWSDTYLGLLGAPDVPPPPVPAVASVSPTSGNLGHQGDDPAAVEARPSPPTAWWISAGSRRCRRPWPPAGPASPPCRPPRLRHGRHPGDQHVRHLGGRSGRPVHLHPLGSGQGGGEGRP